MNTLTIMIAIWGALIVAFIVLMVYRGQLTNHETDQMFLSEHEVSSVHHEQEEIVRRVNRIQPICKGVGGIAVLMTIAIAGTWLYQALLR